MSPFRGSRRGGHKGNVVSHIHSVAQTPFLPLLEGNANGNSEDNSNIRGQEVPAEGSAQALCSASWLQQHCPLNTRQEPQHTQSRYVPQHNRFNNHHACRSDR